MEMLLVEVLFAEEADQMFRSTKKLKRTSIGALVGHLGSEGDNRLGLRLPQDRIMLVLRMVGHMGLSRML